MLTANRASMLAPAPTPNPITLRILLTFSMHCIIPTYVFPLLNLNADDKISMLIIIICSSNSKSYISFFSKCLSSNVLETSHKKTFKIPNFTNFHADWQHNMCCHSAMQNRKYIISVTITMLQHLVGLDKNYGECRMTYSYAEATPRSLVQPYSCTGLQHRCLQCDLLTL